MAHRSGGGSHSHSSSHSSSRSSHSHRRYSSGSAGPVISKRPFTGASKYMYYNKRGEQCYIYSQGMPVYIKTSKFIKDLFFIGIFFALGIFIVYLAITPPKPPQPLVPVYAPTDIHFEDTIGVIDNASSLEGTLQEFEDLTGISPYILTIYDSEWIGSYDELWEYGLSVYYDKFNDEQHFLLVYSQPDGVVDPDQEKISLEGIQGDDTDLLLTDAEFWTFYDEFMRRYSIGSSVGEAFDDIFKTFGYYLIDQSQRNDNDVEIGKITFLALFWNFVIISAFILTIRNYVAGKRMYMEVPMENSVSFNIARRETGKNNISINPVPWDDDSRYRSDDYYNNSENYNNDSNYN